MAEPLTEIVKEPVSGAAANALPQAGEPANVFNIDPSLASSKQTTDEPAIPLSELIMIEQAATQAAVLRALLATTQDPEEVAQLKTAINNLDNIRSAPNMAVMGNVLSEAQALSAKVGASGGGTTGASGTLSSASQAALYNGPYVESGRVTNISSFADHYGYDPAFMQRMATILEQSPSVANDAVILNGLGIAQKIDPDAMARREPHIKNTTDLAVANAGALAEIISEYKGTEEQREAMRNGVKKLLTDPEIVAKLKAKGLSAADIADLDRLIVEHPERFKDLGTSTESISVDALIEAGNEASAADKALGSAILQDVTYDELEALRDLARNNGVDVNQNSAVWTRQLADKVDVPLSEAASINKIPAVQRTAEQNAKIALANTVQVAKAIEGQKVFADMIDIVSRHPKASEMFYGSAENPVSTDGKLAFVNNVLAGNGRELDPESQRLLRIQLDLIKTKEEAVQYSSVIKSGNWSEVSSAQEALYTARALDPYTDPIVRDAMKAEMEIRAQQDTNRDRQGEVRREILFAGESVRDYASVSSIVNSMMQQPPAPELLGAEDASLSTNEDQLSASEKARETMRQKAQTQKDIRAYLEHPWRYANAAAGTPDAEIYAKASDAMFYLEMDKLQSDPAYPGGLAAPEAERRVSERLANDIKPVTEVMAAVAVVSDTAAALYSGKTSIAQLASDAVSVTATAIGATPAEPTSAESNMAKARLEAMEALNPAGATATSPTATTSTSPTAPAVDGFPPAVQDAAAAAAAPAAAAGTNNAQNVASEAAATEKPTPAAYVPPPVAAVAGRPC